MTTNLFAVPMTLDQLMLAMKATDNLPLHSVEEQTNVDAIINDMHVMIGRHKLEKDQRFDVLGWYPGLAQWTHVFTWCRDVPTALTVAERDNIKFNGGFTHFLVIPVPTEGENAEGH